MDRISDRVQLVREGFQDFSQSADLESADTKLLHDSRERKWSWLCMNCASRWVALRPEEPNVPEAAVFSLQYLHEWQMAETAAFSL
ncbi:hypothetical protein P3T76_010905 [Phytophthora citrophthora]|uniref:Uncharacterized protein n=1 Tax=Phytophthora citrophthora TaxID=4793 RepID=A0AAD9LH47_9STRA|nr:hypothetical protein P3T76_010905 [Phytophthora citrophthora]